MRNLQKLLFLPLTYGILCPNLIASESEKGEKPNTVRFASTIGEKEEVTQNSIAPVISSDSGMAGNEDEKNPETLQNLSKQQDEQKDLGELDKGKENDKNTKLVMQEKATEGQNILDLIHSDMSTRQTYIKNMRKDPDKFKLSDLMQLCNLFSQFNVESHSREDEKKQVKSNSVEKQENPIKEKKNTIKLYKAVEKTDRWYYQLISNFNPKIMFDPIIFLRKYNQGLFSELKFKKSSQESMATRLEFQFNVDNKSYRVQLVYILTKCVEGENFLANAAKSMTKQLSKKSIQRFINKTDAEGSADVLNEVRKEESAPKVDVVETKEDPSKKLQDEQLIQRKMVAHAAAEFANTTPLKSWRDVGRQRAASFSPSMGIGSPRDMVSPASPRGMASPVSPRDTASPVSPRDTASPVSPRGTASPVSPRQLLASSTLQKSVGSKSSKDSKSGKTSIPSIEKLPEKKIRAGSLGQQASLGPLAMNAQLHKTVLLAKSEQPSVNSDVLWLDTRAKLKNTDSAHSNSEKEEVEEDLSPHNSDTPSWLKEW